jgi:hypothetical protein
LPLWWHSWRLTGPAIAREPFSTLTAGKPKHSDKGAPPHTSVSSGKAAEAGSGKAILNEKVSQLRD